MNHRSPSPGEPTPPPRALPPVCIFLSRPGLFAILVVLLLPWVFVGIRTAQEAGGRPRGPGAAPQESTEAHAIRSQKGPWGTLDVRRIITEPPPESVLPFLSIPPVAWYLDGYGRGELAQLLEKAGLASDQQTAFLQSASWPEDERNCVITPPDALLWSLSPESRSFLYLALARDSRNILQYDPFRIHEKMAADWFEGSGVPQETQDTIRRLSYRRGQSLVFSDLHLVLPGLPTVQDRIRLLKALARQSSLLVRVHIPQGEDVTTLLYYWRRAGATRDIAPLLESLARLPGGYWLDIIHLLPPMARKRLFTYPLPESTESAFDCHWTSLNFQIDPPDPRFGKGAAARDALNSQYDQVLHDWRFGDVILFMLSETEVIHSAVYIADDIVFTKNGATERSPWALMRMDTVSSFYESAGPIIIKFFRRRPLPPSASLGPDGDTAPAPL